MKKRVLCLILTAAMLICAFPVGAFAENLGAGEVRPEDIERIMQSISDAAGKIDELKDAVESGKQISSAFADFMKVAGYAGTSLTVINGSITFLKLIGIMEDPVKGGIVNILDEIKVMGEKMAEMDTKLDNIAAAMTTLQATTEFNNRALKAQNMCTAWNTFRRSYMENGMEPLMADFNGMLLNGIKAWCLNESSAARSSGGIDNTQIILLYLKDAEGKELPYSFAGNSIPAEYLADSRYVILPADCLPQSLSFNVNSYQKDLTAAIEALITENLEKENYDIFVSGNFPMFTPEGKAEITPEAIRQVATDAVNVLSYRIGCKEVNKDASFAITVNDRFANYCSHLLAAGDGVDAMLKSLYLTHSYESETRKDIQDFMNRMILQTGTYGAFVTNVLGMSDTTLDTTKLTAMKRFCDTVDALNQSLENSLTGSDNYCYITNSEVYYSSLGISAGLTVYDDRIYKDKEVYKDYATTGFIYSVQDFGPSEYAQLGDVNSLLMIYTLKSNGVESLHDYLSGHVKKYTSSDYGNILTSWGSGQTMPLDGSVKMAAYNVLGNDYAGIKTTTLKPEAKDYPDDAGPAYIRGNSKVCGSLYDTASGKLSANKVLFAAAVYGQNHWYWLKDEAAIFAGPADYQYFYSDEPTRYQTGQFAYEDYVVAVSRYNVLVSAKSGSKLQDAQNNPLASLQALNEELLIGLNEPPKPPFNDYPKVESAEELNLQGTVWDQPDLSEERLLRICRELVESAVSAEPLVSGMTEAEKEKAAEKLADFYRQGRNDLNTHPEKYYRQDPLEIGQNNEAVRNLAKDILPDYLLDEEGGVGADVKYLFVRDYVEVIPSVAFVLRDGKAAAEFSLTYEQTPMLLSGDISNDSFELLSFAIPGAETERITVTCPDYPISPETGENLPQMAGVILFAAAAIVSAKRRRKWMDQN